MLLHDAVKVTGTIYEQKAASLYHVKAQHFEEKVPFRQPYGNPADQSKGADQRRKDKAEETCRFESSQCRRTLPNKFHLQKALHTYLPIRPSRFVPGE